MRHTLLAMAGLALAGGIAFAQTPLLENQGAYAARCKRETISAWPGARAQADSICQSNWGMIVAAGPLADSLLALAPAAGTPFEPMAAKARATAVRWAPRAAKGQSAAGKVGETTVTLAASAAQLSWFKNGDVIPFNLEQALRVRGATPAMIGCLAYGAAESTSVYRVAPAGKAPFVLTVARREAAVASQSSDYNVTADFSGRPTTLAALRRSGDEWAATCPQ